MSVTKVSKIRFKEYFEKYLAKIKEINTGIKEKSAFR
jgi:hypothetical protein